MAIPMILLIQLTAMQLQMTVYWVLKPTFKFALLLILLLTLIFLVDLVM